MGWKDHTPQPEEIEKVGLLKNQDLESNDTDKGNNNRAYSSTESGEGNINRACSSVDVKDKNIPDPE